MGEITVFSPYLKLALRILQAFCKENRRRTSIIYSFTGIHKTIILKRIALRR